VVAFVILLAGPGLPGDTLLKLQQAAILPIEMSGTGA
jgi:hypothetical protein